MELAMASADVFNMSKLNFHPISLPLFCELCIPDKTSVLDDDDREHTLYVRLHRSCARFSLLYFQLHLSVPLLSVN